MMGNLAPLLEVDALHCNDTEGLGAKLVLLDSTVAWRSMMSTLTEFTHRMALAAGNALTVSVCGWKQTRTG